MVLFRGRKFHLRAYLIVHNYGGLTVKFAPFAKIITAAKPYVKDQFGDKSIHDTHIASTDADYWFPEDFPVREFIAPVRVQMAQMAECIKECLAKKGICAYSNAKVAYEIYGVDLLVTSSGKLVLIEINDMVGYTRKGTNQIAEAFFEKRARWEWDEILSKLARAYLSD